MSQNQVSETVWTINDLTFNLDMHDVAVMERYEKAFETMEEQEKKIPVDGKASVRSRMYCDLFRNLFDNIFGEGTADTIFGSRYKVKESIETYESFLEFVSNQQAGIEETTNRLVTRFTPNRAQRRAAAKN